MINLKQIALTQKTGEEALTNNGFKTPYNLLDFWRWSVSDILSNATRGRLAEFIVGTAMNINNEIVRKEWDAYDLKTKDGIKIEVKSSSYIQTWSQKKFSNIIFSIKSSRALEGETQLGEPKRQADVYVFCLLKHKVQETIDPLKLEQWEFYVLPTYKIDNYKRSKSSITINSLNKLTNPTLYDDLKTAIEKANIEQQIYLQKLRDSPQIFQFQ